MASAADRFPVEIIEAIVDHVRPFQNMVKEDLLSCSLVSRTWQSIAQPHIFHEISYNFVESAGSRARLEGFYSFLQKSPRISSYIHIFRLNQGIAYTIANRDTLDIGLFKAVLQLLPHLRELSMDGLLVTRETNYSLSSARPSLARVHIKYGLFFAVDRPSIRLDIPAILACFQEVDTLVLSYSDLNFGLPTRLESTHPLSAYRPPLVRRLILSGTGNMANDLPAFLSRCIDTSDIRTLTIKTDVSEHSKLFDFLGPTLERFCIPPLTYDGGMCRYRNKV